MRRKTDRDILREHSWLIIGSVLMILLGILVAILPHIVPVVEDDVLQTKEVTISVFKRHYGGKGSATYDYIRTTDGEKYNLSGDYQYDHLKALLTEGTTVTIRWHRNKPFRTLLAEEMYVDGIRVVAYDNDKTVEWKASLIFGLCFAAIGAGGFCLLDFFLRMNRIKQKKRDEKIMRKYGWVKQQHENK